MWYGMRKLFSSMFLPLSYLQSAGRKIWGKKVFYWITWSDSQTPEATALVKKKNLTSEHYSAPNLKCTEETCVQGIMMGRTEDSEE